MPSSFEKRCQDLFKRSTAARLETERVGRQFEVLRQSSSALLADMDCLLAETHAERQRCASVRHAGSRVAAQCADNLESVRSFLSVQRDLEEEIRRRNVDHAIDRVIEIFAAQGMFAFRYDTDPRVLSRNQLSWPAYVQ